MGADYTAMWQMARLILSLPRRSGIAAVTTPGPPVDRCGGCPSCRALIRIEPTHPGKETFCPDCGRLIRSLEALGSERSPGGTPEL